MGKATKPKTAFPRHRARRAALQALYAHMMSGESDPEKLFNDVVAVNKELRKEVYPFLKKLIISAIEREKFADEIIREVTENWELERIAAIDRNILRLGIAEFLDFPDISPRVTIDEAIELAKEFGDQDSSKFVNGVLDAALRKLRQLGLVTKD